MVSFDIANAQRMFALSSSDYIRNIKRNEVLARGRLYCTDRAQ